MMTSRLQECRSMCVRWYFFYSTTVETDSEREFERIFTVCFGFLVYLWRVFEICSDSETQNYKSFYVYRRLSDILLILHTTT